MNGVAATIALSTERVMPILPGPLPKGDLGRCQWCQRQLLFHSDKRQVKRFVLDSPRGRDTDHAQPTSLAC